MEEAAVIAVEPARKRLREGGEVFKEEPNDGLAKREVEAEHAVAVGNDGALNRRESGVAVSWELSVPSSKRGEKRDEPLESEETAYESPSFLTYSSAWHHGRPFSSLGSGKSASR
jgi:hypothetical protein